MVNRIGTIIQAHMSSRRLPGKVMMKLGDMPILSHVIERAKKIQHSDVLVVATSDLACDDVIAKYCHELGVECFRGSDSDVLDRYFCAAQKYGVSDIVRICSDSPLLDYCLIDDEIRCYFEGDYDIVTCGNRMPLGLDCDVFSIGVLEEAYNKAILKHQREHVIPYILEHSNRKFFYNTADDFSKLDFSIDTIEDFHYIERIYKKLSARSDDFSINEIVRLNISA